MKRADELRAAISQGRRDGIMMALEVVRAVPHMPITAISLLARGFSVEDIRKMLPSEMQAAMAVDR